MPLGALTSLAGGGLSNSSAASANQRSDTQQTTGRFGDINFGEKSLDKNVKNALLFIGGLAVLYVLYKSNKK